MSIASVMTEGETLAVTSQPREKNPRTVVPVQPAVLAAAPVTAPAKTAVPARGKAVVTVPEGRLEGRYWQAVARYLADYSESDVPVFRSPARAAEAAARARASADEAAERALRAQHDTRDASGRIEAARALLKTAPAWQWRARSRARTEAARAERLRAASLRDLDEHAARMELALREYRFAAWVTAVLRRSDRAHLAAAEAAARAMAWRPGDVFPARATVFVAGRDGVEALPARTQR